VGLEELRMNFVGKILVTLIFVMSLVFMSFAVMVYATHKNWKSVVERNQTEANAQSQPLGLRLQLENQKKVNEELEATKEKLESQRKEEIAALADKIAKLETARKTQAEEAARYLKERDELARKEKEAVAALDTSTKNLEKLTAEVQGLRDDIRTTQEDRDKQFHAVVKLTDEVHKKVGELAVLQERNAQLARDVAKARVLLAKHGEDINTSPNATPPALRGKVLAVNADKMIELSLGADDGLRAGNTLDIFRGDRYIGRVQIMRTSSDKAIGKILTEYTKTTVQRGDDVATRLSIS
jgi:DNA repair exonuclease SbcCD ATPase subunit